MGQILTSFLSGNQLMPSEIQPCLHICPEPRWDQKYSDCSSSGTYEWILQWQQCRCILVLCSAQTMPDKVWPCPEQPWMWPCFQKLVCVACLCPLALILMHLLNSCMPNMKANSFWGSSYTLWPCTFVEWVQGEIRFPRWKHYCHNNFLPFAIIKCSVFFLSLFYCLRQVPLMSMQRLLFIDLILF